MSTHQAPSTGQKTNKSTFSSEGAGAVPNKSLAAESIRAGGEFASNRGAVPGSGPAKDNRASAPGSANTNTNPTLENQQSYGGAAPSYVLSQQLNTGGTPHGKNLTEGGFAGSGTSGGRLPEPGSKDDPARAVVSAFAEGQHGRTRQAGLEKDQGEFEALQRDAEA
ncbi:hypothetical protein B0H63DRAFT_61536 [Podospora didyma]|uniref:Uncharacterized protein n=1 Tax=Podospora didyma TaxID=330526 RepID=A0AAE0P8C0_9PEZI|nr:hypothetical protein B0H63DRAFT_61536 [Podospora didyma]